MNPHEPIFVAPLIMEIPDYVWAPRYGRTSYLSGRPIKKPIDTSRQIPHPDAESTYSMQLELEENKMEFWGNCMFPVQLNPIISITVDKGNGHPRKPFTPETVTGNFNEFPPGE